MASKSEKSRLEETFDFVLSHADIVGMMNDSDVLIDGGTVGSLQEFQLLLKKLNGSETVLKDMVATDSIVIRFKKVTLTTNEDTFEDIDVINYGDI